MEVSKTPKKASGSITQLVVAANQYQGGRGSFLFEAWICKDFLFCNDFNYLKENNVLLVTYLNYSNTTEIL